MISISDMILVNLDYYMKMVKDSHDLCHIEVQPNNGRNKVEGNRRSSVINASSIKPTSEYV